MNYFQLLRELKEVIPDNRIYTDESRRLAYGSDAGFYRLIPKLVIKIADEKEAAWVIEKCRRLKIPVTFRAAGTSLSGQAITDSVLLMIDRSWKGYEISKDASAITLDPGVIGGYANLYLKKYNKKIGPDPASINSAMIGGIAANNASGMCCGTAQNSYRTLKSMRIVFNDGFILNTADLSSVEKFKSKKKELIQSIVELKREVEADSELKELIKLKYKLKNTTGYSLNALVDFDDVVDVVEHLMIGSEGTLGFISQITYSTVDDNPHKASALAIFKNIAEACEAVNTLKLHNPDAVEIMDRASLRSVENKDGMPGYLKGLNDECAALLIEISEIDEGKLRNKIAVITDSLRKYELESNFEFTSVEEEYAKLWNIRKGLFPSVGAMRESGTTVVIEDVCYPQENLADAATELRVLFRKYGYNEAIIFGHALEGNLHFVFNQNFNDDKEIERYKNLMNEVVKITARKYNGSLKAEHGTGRNMAPFVKYEWGEKAYELMKRIKKAFDPENVLNPGVLINEDEFVHLKNFKHIPKVHKLIDKCIECGFCEDVCPSKDLTLTPRQRIILLRELKRGGLIGGEAESISGELNYDINQTCAVDGLCGMKCPVGIDTGEMIKLIRGENISKTGGIAADLTAANFSAVIGFGKAVLNGADFTARLVGREKLKRLTESFRKIANGTTPVYLTKLPAGNKYKFPFSVFNGNKPKVVYFPSCINRMMGEEGKEPLAIVFSKLLYKAGYEVVYPANINELCCGMPFASKGYAEQAELKASQLYGALLKASAEGEYPVVFDMSPCAKTEKDFANKMSGKIEIYDSIEFAHDCLIDKLKIKQLDRSVALHPVCSAQKMELNDKMREIAELCARNVIVPPEVSCCGFAGDRGFTVPELNESALKNLKVSLHDECSEGYSSSRTCEIGLSEQSGIDYRSIIYLIAEASE